MTQITHTSALKYPIAISGELNLIVRRVGATKYYRGPESLQNDSIAIYESSVHICNFKVDGECHLHLSNTSLVTSLLKLRKCGHESL